MPHTDTDGTATRIAKALRPLLNHQCLTTVTTGSSHQHAERRIVADLPGAGITKQKIRRALMDAAKAEVVVSGYARHGVLIKQYHNAHMEYTPSEMIGTERRPIDDGVDPYSICTSQVERHNLTCRTFMKRIVRLTICFSKKLENLAAAVAMFMAYFDYCWQTRYPNTSGRPGTKRPTAAMMAKLTGHVWSFAELFATVMPAKVAA